MMTCVFEQILAHRLLRPIDIQVARLISRIDREQCQELPLLAALTSLACGQGHSCLPLAAVPQMLSEGRVDPGALPPPDILRTRLLASPALGQPGAIRPLILDARNNLFLYRLFRDEEVIARALRQRIECTASMEAAVTKETVLSILAQLFPESPESDSIDWQRSAAVLALLRPFLVITGGAGTGKTYTAARILALLIALAPTPLPLRIALAAPTGKAALRLQESIRAAKADLPEALAAQIPDQAQTLHRLLGYQQHRPDFFQNSTNLLHLDLLMVDEASMIDVPLMAATLSALPATCRIILLGDQDQLASVEAGKLFADLCGDGRIRWSAQLRQSMQPFLDTARLPAALAGPDQPLADSLIRLQVSRRFQRQSGISALAQALQSGEPEALEAVLRQSFPDLHLEAQSGAVASLEFQKRLQERMLPCIRPLFTADSPRQALQALGAARVLCALREGTAGVEGINRLAEGLCRRHGQIPQGERLYRGLPVLILRNAYSLGLFNGDTGVLWPDDRGRLVAWFPCADGQLKSLGIGRLPAWQPSYALTVHKSQGSEFDQVLLLLPEEDSPVLSRELLYTGITRARSELSIWCRPSLLRLVSQRRVIRFSGLGSVLCAVE